jgi:hypothetical protein
VDHAYAAVATYVLVLCKPEVKIALCKCLGCRFTNQPEVLGFVSSFCSHGESLREGERKAPNISRRALL